MSQIILVVDRIEGDTAVLELGDQLFDVPLAILPLIKEGDQVQIVRVDNAVRAAPWCSCTCRPAVQPPRALKIGTHTPEKS